jgi:hypothetical protein
MANGRSLQKKKTFKKEDGSLSYGPIIGWSLGGLALAWAGVTVYRKAVDASDKDIEELKAEQALELAKAEKALADAAAESERTKVELKRIEQEELDARQRRETEGSEAGADSFAVAYKRACNSCATKEVDVKKAYDKYLSDGRLQSDCNARVRAHRSVYRPVQTAADQPLFDGKNCLQLTQGYRVNGRFFSCAGVGADAYTMTPRSWPENQHIRPTVYPGPGKSWKDASTNCGIE